MTAQYDPLNPEESKEDVRRLALVESTQQASDVRRLMAEEWGRRLMWTWLEFGGAHRLTFTAGQPDQTAFNEGVRNFGLMLLASVMEHAPEQWLAMQQEAKQAAAEAAARRDDGRQPGAFRRALTRLRG